MTKCVTVTDDWGATRRVRASFLPRQRVLVRSPSYHRRLQRLDPDTASCVRNYLIQPEVQPPRQAARADRRRRLFRVRGAAQYFGMTESRARTLAASGELNAVRSPRGAGNAAGRTSTRRGERGLFPVRAQYLEIPNPHAPWSRKRRVDGRAQRRGCVKASANTDFLPRHRLTPPSRRRHVPESA
jgi:hypothetical protein